MQSSCQHLLQIGVCAVVAQHMQILWWIALGSYQAQKGSKFSVCLRWGKFSHSFQVLLAGLDALLGYMVGQILDLTLEEFALTQLELQIMFPEALEHNAHKHVIQVNSTIG